MIVSTREEAEAMYASLTPSERRIFDWIGTGVSTKLIARNLGIHGRTVDSHRDHIRKKLRLRQGDSLAVASMIILVFLDKHPLFTLRQRDQLCAENSTSSSPSLSSVRQPSF